MPDDSRRVLAFAVITVVRRCRAIGYAVYAARRASAESTPAGDSRRRERRRARHDPGGRPRAFQEHRARSGLRPRHDRASSGSLGGPLRRLRSCANVSTLPVDRLLPDRRSWRLHEVLPCAHLRRALQGAPSSGARWDSQSNESSPDGRVVAVTVFVSGHSYSAGSFSTLTTLIDTATGAGLGDLEQFAVTRDGKPFKAVDFNFWGVTFAAGLQHVLRDARDGPGTASDSGRRCRSATASRAARWRRVSGALAGRHAVGIQAPPHRERCIRHGALATLDLQTLTDRLVPGELRSVDDQVEWLDANHLLYGVTDDESGLGGTSVWKVNVDSGPAAVWLRGAYSPSVSLPGQP